MKLINLNSFLHLFGITEVLLLNVVLSKQSKGSF